MENYLEFLDILFSAFKTVFTFDKMYVLVAVFGTIIIVLIKEIGKTKRVEIEQKGETERTKIAEVGQTERTKMAMIESLNESNNMKNAILGLASSMPPEELQKQNNSDLLYISNIMKEKAKKNRIENEIRSDKNSQKEKDKKDKKSNEEADNDDDKKILDFFKKILKKDESNGN